MPPPQTITMNIPEAFSVYFPRPSTAKLKIPPHITEVHNPTNTNNAALIGTWAKMMFVLISLGTGVAIPMLLTRKESIKKSQYNKKKKAVT